MVQKRQLADEEYDVSTKHLKLEHSCDLVSSLQFTKEDAPIQSDKNVDCFYKPKVEVDDGFGSGNFTDLPVCATKDFTLPGRLSTSSWASSTISEEDARSDAPPQTPVACSYLLEHSPLKQVPIGPEYQADIPEWHEFNDDDSKFTGYCVIPRPEDPTIHDNDNYDVVAEKTDCYCKYPGSIECVKQHIKEAREILKASIGHKTFADLGFEDMGEVVAEKWSEEDEQLFHDVVYSNPVSLGRNFWNHLAAEFPSRANKEIVSYYFNFFMLQRRAEQNRCDHMNADSDDDEWQGNEKSEEEDEVYEYDSYEHGNGNGIENQFNDSQRRKLHNSCSFDSISDSCTSSDTAVAPYKSKVNNSLVNHEFMFEPLDSRVWDVGYFSCSRTETDFLPTGSMIEEVFGVESWNFEMADDNKSSNL